MTFGPWMMGAFRTLAKLRRFRGGALDLFGRTAERRMERALIVEYETTVGELVASLRPDNHALAVEIAQVPEHIRGYGHVKERHVKAAKEKEAALLARFRAPRAPAPAGTTGGDRRLNEGPNRAAPARPPAAQPLQPR